MESLTKIFKSKWEHQKSRSTKLSFYHETKSIFGLEAYLECKNLKFRSSTTQLRISAHDLQVERGWYINLPREKRICFWCKTSLDQGIIENKSHVFAGLCKKLNLNREPLTTHSKSVKVTNSNIQTSLMSILSPNLINTQLKTIIHPEQSPKIMHHTDAFDSLCTNRTYLISCICSYISRCFNERKKLSKSTRAVKSSGGPHSPQT